MIEYTDFFTKGFCFIENSGLTNYFGNIDNYNIKDSFDMGDEPKLGDNPTELNEILLQVREKIVHEHLTKIFKNYTPLSYFIWDKVDSVTSDWHTDNQDCSFLLYFDDTDEFTGGALSVKDYQNEYKIYPKKDMLIWLNQNKKFLHKAENSNKKRRLAIFQFNL
jgi:hypothetical protein